MAKRSMIRVEGDKELKRLIRRIGNQELRDEMKEANFNAASIIAEKAADLAPKRTGRLANSIRANKAIAYGAVRAGSAARVPYAGPIHYGWPAKGIQAQPFIHEAIDKRLGKARKGYEEAIRKLAKKLES